jgi:hypothetical protein
MGRGAPDDRPAAGRRPGPVRRPGRRRRILVALGAGRLGRGGDIMAVADATRECTACLGGWGPCTCAEPCGSIRCTAWDDAITPGQLRLVRDTKENTQ